MQPKFDKKITILNIYLGYNGMVKYGILSKDLLLDLSTVNGGNLYLKVYN
jgi:hypothetical protein